MGYASGSNYRDELIGYGHEAVCTEPGCEEKIDKGLAYTCGGMEGVQGEAGCGRHFCSAHLFYPFTEDDDDPRRDEGRDNDALCPHCIARWERGLSTGMEDDDLWSEAARS